MRRLIWTVLISAIGVLCVALPAQAQTPTDTPAPTPTTTPAVLSYTLATTLLVDERYDADFTVDCDVVDVVTCTSTGDAWLYTNGRRSCACGVSCEGFYTRWPLTNTLTLFNRESVTNTVEVYVGCETYGEMSAQSGLSFAAIPATPTMMPFPMPPVVTDTIGALGVLNLDDGGIPMPNTGEDISVILAYARKTINTVDSGNALWVFAAVSMAGMVLGWAIKEVRNPRSWR